MWKNPLIKAKARFRIPDMAHIDDDITHYNPDTGHPPPPSTFLCDQSHYCIAGSPEGIISARTGAIAIDTDSCELWLKRTGTEKTGWCPVGGEEGEVAGLGTPGFVPLWATPSTLTDSLLQQVTGDIVLTSGQLLLPNGTAAAPSIAFANDSGTGFRLNAASDIRLSIGGISRHGWTGDTYSIFQDAARIAFGSSSDAFIRRDDPNIIAIRNGTAAQEFRIWNTDGVTIDEFVSIGFKNNANILTIQTEQVGGGTVKNIAFMGGKVSVGTLAMPPITSINANEGIQLSGQLVLSGGGDRTIRTDNSSASLRFGLNEALGVTNWKFHNNSIEVARITSNGSLLLGTTSNTGKVVISQGTITTDLKALDISTTWNNAAVAFGGINLAVTGTAAANTSRLINLVSDGFVKFQVAKRSGTTYDTHIDVGGRLGWLTNSQFESSVDGSITLLNAAATSFTALNFGGVSASFPSLRVSGAELHLKLADNSAFTTLQSGHHLPGVDDTFDLGSSSLRWKDLYLGPGSILIGDNPPATGIIKVDGGTVIGSTPVINLNQTLNNGAVQFRAFDLNITNTASSIASTLFRIRVDGTTVFGIRVGGLWTIGGSPLSANEIVGANSGATAMERKTITGAGGITINQSVGGIEIDGAGVGGTAAGPEGAVQLNQSSAFAGEADFIWEDADDTIRLGQGDATSTVRLWCDAGAPNIFAIGPAREATGEPIFRSYYDNSAATPKYLSMAWQGTPGAPQFHIFPSQSASLKLSVPNSSDIILFNVNTGGPDPRRVAVDATGLQIGTVGVNGSRMTMWLFNTANLDFGTIGATNSVTRTITVTGALASDVVAVGYPDSFANTELILVAWVSAADTVSIKAKNPNAVGGITPGASDFDVFVFQGA